jgi:succinate dehydrogenase / fumarate reductase flavoprotein subunit
MIQYHPTTIQIPGKRLLVSEAARGEGGRLFVVKNGKPWYFMEELHPEFGNLATRDVVSREMVAVVERMDCEKQVYLDMTALSSEIWSRKLSDLRKEIIHYLDLDPAKEPIPVKPGIHYFMGGILVDENHKTNMDGLYAAGECACQYHGANRLGGNSMLGAIYGGKVAAASSMKSPQSREDSPRSISSKAWEQPKIHTKLQAELLNGLGILRDEDTIQLAIDRLEAEEKDDRIHFALAMLYSAKARKESRGAHYRKDYPHQNDDYRKTTVAQYQDGKIEITFREIPTRKERDL